MKSLIFLLLAITIKQAAFGEKTPQPRFASEAMQPDSLPPQYELFETLRAFHAENTAANIAVFDIQDKNKWMRYTPSLGLGYNLQGSPRPTLNFSLSQILNASEQKEIRAAEKVKILRGANIAFKVDSFALIALLARHATLNRSMLFLEGIAKVEADKFELDKRRYHEEGKITLSEWLDIQAAYMRGSEAYFKRKEEIELLEIDILKQAKF